MEQPMKLQAIALLSWCSYSSTKCWWGTTVCLAPSVLGILKIRKAKGSYSRGGPWGISILAPPEMGWVKKCEADLKKGLCKNCTWEFYYSLGPFFGRFSKVGLSKMKCFCSSHWISLTNRFGPAFLQSRFCLFHCMPGFAGDFVVLVAQCSNSVAAPECTVVTALELWMRMRILTHLENSLAIFSYQVPNKKLWILRCREIRQRMRMALRV